MDIEALKQWIGKTETQRDTLSRASMAALAATLDDGGRQVQSGDPIAPCAHWLCFLPIVPMESIGSDGHPKRGGFLPPVPLPRRMWAAGRIEFQRALAVGEDVSRTSRIVDVSAKQGRSGPLVFVRVRHEVSGPMGLAIAEDQDIVYRDLPQSGDAPHAVQAAGTDEQFCRRVVPDPVLLFRYSALTFNGHRIHYDRPYAMSMEHYPGLVVHGPLIATLLLDTLRRHVPGVVIHSFEFKAVSALFDTAPFELCGRIDGANASLWARGPEGRLAMQASARISQP
jgi:3-methylfumaryl-CoA hydratase